jgi:hypothetical protein
MAASALAGAAISILGACAGSPPQPVADAPPPPAAVPAAAAPPPPAAASPPQAAAVPAATGARGLIGLTREDVTARFGPAGFVRRDGPAEVWRYRATECFLELFIYRDADNSQRVAHVDARNFAGRPASADMCLTRLVAEKRG